MRLRHRTCVRAGTYGKFEPNRPVDVPIWLAIELRKRNQCDIRLPPWMTLKELKEVVAKERTDMSSFQPLPFHYVEVRGHFAEGRLYANGLPTKLYRQSCQRRRRHLSRLLAQKNRSLSRQGERWHGESGNWKLSCRQACQVLVASFVGIYAVLTQ